MCALVVTQHQTFLSLNEHDATNGMATLKCSRPIKISDIHLETICFDPAVKEAIDVLCNYYTTV